MALNDTLLGEAPPLVGYRFAVVLFPGLVPMLAPLDMRFQSISGLKATRTLKETDDPTIVRPTVSRQVLTCKRGMPSSPTPLQVIHLLEQALWEEKVLSTGILVTLLGDGAVPLPLKAWMVPDAHLTTIEWQNLDATSNQVLIESMSYSYSRIIPVPI